MKVKKSFVILFYCIIFMVGYGFHFSNSFASSSKISTYANISKDSNVAKNSSVWEDFKRAKEKDRPSWFKTISSSRAK